MMLRNEIETWLKNVLEDHSKKLMTVHKLLVGHVSGAPCLTII